MEIAVTVPYLNPDYFHSAKLKDKPNSDNLIRYIVVALLVCPLDILESIHVQKGCGFLFLAGILVVLFCINVCPVKSCIIMRSFWNIKHAAYIDRNDPYIGLVLAVMFLPVMLLQLWWKMPYHAIQQKRSCRKHKKAKKIYAFAQYTFIVFFCIVYTLGISIIVQHLLDRIDQVLTAPFNVTTLVRAVSNLTRKELMVGVLTSPLVLDTLNLCKLVLVIMYTAWSCFCYVSTHDSIAKPADAEKNE
jgi:hypothetical protein